MHFERIIVDSLERINLMEDETIILAVAPQYGARLASLKMKYKETYHDILWSVSDSDLRTNDWYKNTILFPYPNRLEDGQYEFEGKTYQFPVNEADKNNQLHGMLFSAPFQEGASVVKAGEASITFFHDYDGALAYYPFPFRFSVTYTYSPEGLQVKFRVDNTGKGTLPFGVGWHPYFRLDDEKIQDCTFSAQQLTRIQLSERSLPTGEKSTPEMAQFRFDQDVLDDAFTVDYTPVTYDLKKGDDLTVHFEASESMSYLQVFTPEGGDAVAIEPMTSNINAFNNKDGIQYLGAGESFEALVRLSLQ